MLILFFYFITPTYFILYTRQYTYKIDFKNCFNIMSNVDSKHFFRSQFNGNKIKFKTKNFINLTFLNENVVC